MGILSAVIATVADVSDLLDLLLLEFGRVVEDGKGERRGRREDHGMCAN